MSGKKNPPPHFTGLLDDVPTPNSSAPKAAPAKPAKPAKGPLLAFHIDEDLKEGLDRVVHHMGRNGSQRAVLNKALRALLEADPRSRQPIPDEE